MRSLLTDASRLHRRPARLWRLGRRLAPAATAALLLCAAAFGMIAPLLESDGNAQIWTFAYVPLLASLMLGLILWLALFSAAPRPAPKRTTQRARAASRRRTGT